MMYLSSGPLTSCFDIDRAWNITLMRMAVEEDL